MTRSSKKEEKRSMEKSAKSWECPHGCRATKTPCEHLEALLPKPRQRPILPFTELDTNQLAAPDKPSPDRELQFERFIAKLGLNESEKRLLRYRFLYNWSLRDIADEFHYTEAKTVLRHVNHILTRVRPIIAAKRKKASQ